MASEALGLEPSIGACIGYSALGGALEVLSTMVLAYPEYQAKRGQPHSHCFMRTMVVINLVLMGIASIAYILGSWYGPVSLSVPVVMVSKLLFNLIMVGSVLRMESFSKDQRVGVYVICFAIFALPEVGPGPQPEQNVTALLVQPASIAWSAVMVGAMALSILAMIFMALRKRPTGSVTMLVVLLTAQVTSAVVGTSVGKVRACMHCLSSPLLTSPHPRLDFSLSRALHALRVLSALPAPRVLHASLVLPVLRVLSNSDD